MKILRLNIILFVVILCFAAACRADKLSPEDIREPAVAGQFYPLSASRLRLAIEKYLQDAMVVSIRKPVAMIVPHAGYIFPGRFARTDLNRPVTIISMWSSFWAQIIPTLIFTRYPFTAAAVFAPRWGWYPWTKKLSVHWPRKTGKIVFWINRYTPRNIPSRSSCLLFRLFFQRPKSFRS